MLEFFANSSNVLNSYLIVLLMALLFFIPSFFIRSKKILHLLSFLPTASLLLISILTWIYVDVEAKQSIYFNWIHFESLSIQASFSVDAISIQMIAMISFIASMVMLYSIEYMRKEEKYARFFAYIQLFVFAMVTLVLSSNLFITYIAWELVGFCSYLLIGFWTQKQSAVLANKNAFIVNRIGDIGFLAGLMILLSVYNTFDYQLLKEYQFEVFKNLSIEKQNLLNISGFCFLIAVIAKSAQFPLHIWLPDAMEGPTPISALIHAATMVIAGIYLLIRLHFLLSIDVHNFIIVLAAFTSFMAAFVALKQYDLKKILAYSTISQLGYMLSGIGAANEGAAFNHLYAHAFYKASLFLAAGVIIHTMHSQDIRNAQALRKQLPITFIAFTLAAASLIGIPFFSGFYSKDTIIAHVLDWSISRNNNWLLFAAYLNIASVALTALYVARMFWYLFLRNRNSSTSELQAEPRIYKITLLLLMPLSILTISNTSAQTAHDYKIIHALPYLIVAVLMLAIIWVWYFYKNNKQWTGFIANTSAKELYVDVAIQKSIVPLTLAVARLSSFVDKYIVDGLVNLSASFGIQISKFMEFIDRYVVDAAVNYSALLMKRLGDFIRAFQTGKTQSYYAISILVLVIIIWIIKS